MPRGTRATPRLERALVRRAALFDGGGELDLHAARADGLEQNRRIFRAEEERCVSGPLLHELQKHVLVLFRQDGAVLENVDLARALVRADERVGAHRAYRVDRELLVLCVAHERDVGVDVLHHLAAGRAGEAGLAFRCALHRRGGIARSAHAVAAAAENGDSSSQTIFYADQDGVVVYGSDGYESYTEDSLTPELFSTKASVVSFDSGAQTEPGNAVYRLVTDEQWEIAVPVTNKQVVTLSNFSTIKVKFLKDGKTQTGTLNLKSINDQNYAVISFTSGMIRYAEDRFLSVELVTNTGSGLKIPNTAITEKDFYKIPAQMLVQGGDSNSSGFLREKTDKKGNVMLDDNGQPVTEFVNATIYEQVNDENDNPVEYYVDMAAFNDGDILRAQDSATTYQIGETVPLQGVYCINKGYAVFRKIQIIDQNAEYSIIKKQTQYGISQYDYIVENASTVSEEDIVH